VVGVKQHKMEQPLPTDSQYQGTPGEDPSSPWWGSGNYVGPYWSNGKVQPSVEWGDAAPVHALDELARQHDAAYAHWEDKNHREAADQIFATEARKLKQKYGSKIADDPRYAAAIVQYGNYAHRKASKLAANVGSYGPLGVLKFGYDNIVEMNRMLKGTHLKKELASVSKFYAEAPKPGKYVSFGNSTAVGPSGQPKHPDVSGNPRSKTPSGVVSAAPRQEVTVVKPNSNPGPHSNLLWPSNQAKRFAKYNSLQLAAAASKSRNPVYVKPKLNLNKALPSGYKKKKKQNRWQRNSVRPL
jgi:hypothetical protein